MENQLPTSPPSQPSEQNAPAPAVPKSPLIFLFPIALLIILIAAIIGVGEYTFRKQTIQTPSSPVVETPIQPIPTTKIEQVMTPIVSTTPIANPTRLDWNNYSIPSINVSFQYPSHLIVTNGVMNSTPLAADQQYVVGYDGSDIEYLNIYLYGSNKTPYDWWDSEGKAKFDKLAEEVGTVASPDATVTLTYDTKQSTFAGKEALDITVKSDLISPHTPAERFITLIQQNGFIVMISYHDIGTVDPSLDTTKQILSTFKFTN